MAATKPDAVMAAGKHGPPEAADGTSRPRRPPQVHKLTVLYGSQTGCAQDVAERIGREAQRRGFVPHVSSMSDFEVGSLPEQRLVVFVASTTGDGEVPDNMRAFWRFLLRKSLPADSLRGVGIAVFGLGDSSYAKFNAAARKLHVRLRRLGAHDVVERGLADDQSVQGLEGDADRWIAALWAKLLEMHPIPDGCVVDDTPQRLVSRYQVRHVSAGFQSARDAASKPAPAAMAPPPGPPSAVDGSSSSGAVGAVGGAGADLATERDAGAQAAASAAASAAAPAATATASDGSSGAAAAAAINTAGMAPLDDGTRGVDTRKVYQPFYAAMAPAGVYAPSGRWVHFGRLVGNRRLTAPDWPQDVRHLDIDISGSGLESVYRAGDVAVVHPTNLGDGGDAVRRLCSRMGLDPHQRVEIQTRTVSAAEAATAVGGDAVVPTSRLVPLPAACSVYDLFAHYFDILACPRRGWFEQLSLFAKDEEQAERLLEMARAEGADIFHNYVTRERRNYVECLEDFDSVELPLPVLIELVPPLPPREFSIASSPSRHGNIMQLCVGLVSYRTPSRKRVKTGVCSSWLSRLVPAPPEAAAAEAASAWARGGRGGVTGTLVPLFIKPGTLRLPPDLATPLVLVGPGTGFAPMRALLEERQALMERAAASAPRPLVVDGAAKGADEPGGAARGSGAAAGGAHPGASVRASPDEHAEGAAGAAAVAVAGAAGAAASSVAAAGAPTGGQVLLYFGCRKEAKDWLYRDEMLAMSAQCTPEPASKATPAAGVDGTGRAPAGAGAAAACAASRGTVVTRLFTAFSRDQPHKVYVQKWIAASGDAVFRALVEERGYCFISGSAKRMPADVSEVLRDVICAHGKLSMAEADGIIASLQREGRLVVEAWS